MRPSAYRGFWRFVVLRQLAYWRHERGEGPPYSDDPAISRYHFCNVYREADRGSRWFQAHRSIDEVPEQLRQTLEDAIAYRPLNRVSTFEAYGRGVPARRGWPEWVEFLRARQASGERVFTGRHMVKSLDVYEAGLSHASYRSAQMAKAISGADGLEQVTRIVRAVPGIGPFFAWQVTCDLLEAEDRDRRAGRGGWLGEGVRMDRHEWALLGPGARAGAEIVDPVAHPLDTALRLVDSQPRDGSLAPPPEAPGPFTLKNVEHALCEYARWVRASDPSRSAGLEVRAWAK